MGSPLSPALCALVVGVSEQLWCDTHASLSGLFSEHALMLRYVDSWQDLQSEQELLHEQFYGGSILLEPEPTSEFLGYMLDVQGKQISSSQLLDASRALSVRSASCSTIKTAGYLSLVASIKRCSWPTEQVRKDLLLLRRFYCEQGYPAEWLPLTKKIRAAKPHVHQQRAE